MKMQILVLETNVRDYTPMQKQEKERHISDTEMLIVPNLRAIQYYRRLPC